MGSKKKTTDLDAEIRDIQSEARSSFSLRERLVNKNSRRKTKTVYTDAEAGEELGYAVDEEYQGIKSGRRLRRGLVGELDALEEEGKALLKAIDAAEEPSAADTDRAREISAETKRIRAEITAVKKRLKGSSMDFTLHTLPKPIIKGVKHQTRSHLKIKGKGVPEALLEDYNEEYSAQMLAASTESWIDHETGETHDQLTVDQARELFNYLPEGQFSRLDQAMLDLSFEATIANAGTDSADF